ncbi:MAG: SGNH/GDSL hydrolase family protein [Pseudomonadota bacterium]
MAIADTKVFFFGDSLSDVGVVFGAAVEALTAQILAGLIAQLPFPPTPQQLAILETQAAAAAEVQATALVAQLGFGPQNAVTNEFTHVNYFADLSGTHAVNFANAGARALGTQEPLGEGTGYDSNLGAQLERFTASLTAPLDPSSKAVLFIGSNDFSDLLGAAADAPGSNVFDLIAAATGAVEALLAALEAAARALDSAGVGTIYFGTLPVGSFFPGADDLDALEAGLSDLTLAIYNGLLADLASDLRGDGLGVEIIDYAALADAITEDPSSFGIVAPRADFLVDGSSFDSDQVGFWDPIHPAEAIHQAWGAYADFVVAGGSTASLSDFGTVHFGTNGMNAIFAQGGDDVVFARRGDDVVFGGSGADDVFGGRGDDILSGGTSGDFLTGQIGNDIIDGGAGDDTLRGGAGDDVMLDGLGRDDLRAGGGDDVIIFVEGVLEGDASATQDIFRGGAGSDALYLVLSEETFGLFEGSGAASTLAALGVTTRGIEEVIAIEGRDGVEAVLGDTPWFQTADYWGLVPAPTTEEDPLLL